MKESIFEKLLVFIFILIILAPCLYIIIFTTFLYYPYETESSSPNLAPKNTKVYIVKETKKYYPVTPRTLEILEEHGIDDLEITTISKATDLGFTKDENFDCYSYGCSERCILKELFNQPSIPWDKEGNWVLECGTSGVVKWPKVTINLDPYKK